MHWRHLHFFIQTDLKLIKKKFVVVEVVKLFAPEQISTFVFRHHIRKETFNSNNSWNWIWRRQLRLRFVSITQWALELNPSGISSEAHFSLNFSPNPILSNNNNDSDFCKVYKCVGYNRYACVLYLRSPGGRISALLFLTSLFCVTISLVTLFCVVFLSFCVFILFRCCFNQFRPSDQKTKKSFLMFSSYFI